MCLFGGVFQAHWLCVMDGKEAAANMWDVTKHCYAAITYTHPTINTSALHTQCKRPPHCVYLTDNIILLFSLVFET